MTKRVFSIILVSISIVMLASCTFDITSPDDSPDDSWESIFLQYWNVMNAEYVRFETESDLDWDEVYEKYLPLFKELDYSSKDDSITAFKYFKEIAVNIDDSHYDLIVRDNFNNFLWMSPARERKWESKSGLDHRSYPDVSSNGLLISVDGKTVISLEDEEMADKELREFYGAVEGYYEVKDLTSEKSFHESGTSFKTSSSCTFKTYENPSSEKEKAWNEIVNTFDIDGFSYYYGVTEENIFYFYFSSFISYVDNPLSEELIYKETLSEEDKEKLGGKYIVLHDYLWANLPESVPYFKGIYDMFTILGEIGKDGICRINGDTYTITGVIMDLRSNSGGDNSTLETIFGSFFRSETKFAETRYKVGYSRYEYGPWLDMTIEETYCNGVRDYEDPFVVITNGNSISCAELSAAIIKNLMKNGAVAGGTTYGATCTKVPRSLYHSGSFSSKNLNIVMASVETKFKTKSGEYVSYENKGIEPTEGLSVDVDDTYKTDTRFEKAVEWVRNKLQL